MCFFIPNSGEKVYFFSCWNSFYQGKRHQTAKNRFLCCVFCVFPMFCNTTELFSGHQFDTLECWRVAMVQVFWCFFWSNLMNFWTHQNEPTIGKTCILFFIFILWHKKMHHMGPLKINRNGHLLLSPTHQQSHLSGLKCTLCTLKDLLVWEWIIIKWNRSFFTRWPT